MGMSASQARMLSITARLSDLELSAQAISNSKIRLSVKSEDVSKAYAQALNNKMLVYQNTTQQVNANNLTDFNADAPYEAQRLLKTATGQLLVSSTMANAYAASNNGTNFEAFLNGLGYTSIDPSTVASTTPPSPSAQGGGATGDIEPVVTPTPAVQGGGATGDIDPDPVVTPTPAVQGGGATGDIDPDPVVTPTPAVQGGNDIDPEPVVTPTPAVQGGQSSERPEQISVITPVLDDAVAVDEKESTKKTILPTEETIIDEKSEKSEKLAELKVEEKASDVKTETPIADIKNTSLFGLLNGIKTEAQSDAVKVPDEKLESTVISADGSSSGNILKTQTDVIDTVVNTDNEKATKSQESSSELKTQLDTDPVVVDTVVTDKTASTPVTSTTTTSTPLTSAPADLIYDTAILPYYQTIFDQIKENGLSKVNDDSLLNNSDWLYSQLQNGNLHIEKYSNSINGGEGGFQTVSFDSGDTALQEVYDTSDDAAAEADYNSKMAAINTKDKQFDLDLKNIDTEHNALQTELDSVKKVADKNIERSFKIFG